ncbi:MAG: T9SS type A sorting domain-containing protein [Chitinophagales bacterium]
MTNRILHFTFFMSLMLIFAANIQAQKFQNKGDLKPIIDNVIIWNLIQTAVDLDRSNGAAGVGTFEGSDISGSETTGHSDVVENDDTQDETEEDNDVIETGDENDDTGVSINPGGLITENTLPSRGGNENDGITETGNDTDAIEVGKPDTFLDEIVTYPNPASDRINVSIPLTDELVRVRLINLAGQSVLNRTTYGNSRMILETYHLPEGVYLLEFTGDTKQVFKRTYIKR